MADKKKLSPKTPQGKDIKEENGQGNDAEEVVVLVETSALAEEEKKEGAALKIIKDKENEALKLFNDDAKSEVVEKDVGLEKADLTQIGSVTGLKGKVKKNAADGEVIELKSNIILMAQQLLKVAGTSVADLNSDGKGKKKGLGSAPKHPLTSTSDKTFMEQDVAILTHHDVEKIEATVLKNDPLAQTSSSKKSSSSSTFEGALSDEELELRTLEQQDTIYRGNPGTGSGSKKKTGFFHYFGLISICLMVLGSVAYGVYFLTTLLTNNNKPDYLALQNELNEKQANQESSTKVKTPITEENPVIEEAKSVVKNFIGADVKRFAYTFIIQNNEISKVFNKYWKPTERLTPVLLTFDKAYTLPNKATWVSFLYGEEGAQRKLVLIKAEDSPFRIDWQAYSEVQGTSLADLLKEVKTEPRLIRTWITPAHYYPAGYPDNNWQNYLARDLQGNTLNCYVPLATKSAKGLYENLVSDAQSYPKAKKDEDGTYVILMVRKPVIGADFVEIIDVIDTTWFPELETQQ